MNRQLMNQQITESPFAPYNISMLPYFRQKIQLAISNIETKKIDRTPLLVEDLKNWEIKTGERGREIEKFFIETRSNGGHLLDLKAALKRTENNTYGFCRTCGTAMPIGRLDAIAEVNDCVGCHAKKIAKRR